MGLARLAIWTAIALVVAAPGALAETVYDCSGIGVITDANGNAVVNDRGQVGCIYTTYDATVRLTGQSEASTTIGRPTTTQYDYDGNVRRVETIDEPAGRTVQTQYDADGQMVRTTTQTDPQHSYVTQYRYDDGDRVTSTVDAAGQDYPAGRTVQYQYDPNPGTDRTTTVYDGVGRTLTYTYDPGTHLLDEVQDSLGTRTMYDYTGGRLTEADTMPTGGGPITRTFYDYDGGRLSDIRDAAGTTRFAYDDGMLLSVTDPSGNVTKFVYDAVGRVKSDSDPAGDVNLIYSNAAPEPGSLLLLATSLGLLAARRRRRA
jgi:YD repeat-containing protein